MCNTLDQENRQHRSTIQFYCRCQKVDYKILHFTVRSRGASEMDEDAVPKLELNNAITVNLDYLWWLWVGALPT